LVEYVLDDIGESGVRRKGEHPAKEKPNSSSSVFLWVLVFFVCFFFFLFFVLLLLFFLLIPCLSPTTPNYSFNLFFTHSFLTSLLSTLSYVPVFVDC